MTSRTEDFKCPRCRKYLFSAYTYTMSKQERDKLNERAAKQCHCKPKAPKEQQQ
ncbi:hypothetical protein WG922_21385 [Ramlibacter sp. AN1015]|uniref:hypothetical protein n=1 Tax=Ramlibacter sp. AN1015 TaxID=3133428 RepID=UPI0030BF550F